MQTIIEPHRITSQQRLGEFLRLKRTNISPESVGLMKPSRSRTPGLRREDVAERANISVVWYAKLERGKAERVSRQVLLSVSQALCCDDSEIRYLLQLSGHSEPRAKYALNYSISDSSARLLKQLNPLPAVFVNDYKDIIQANVAFNRMVGFDVNAQAFELRNMVLFASSCPQWQRWLKLDSELEFQTCMQRTAAGVRVSMANRACESEWQNRLEQLLLASEPFKQAWEKNSVKEFDENKREYQHARLGKMVLHKQLWGNSVAEVFGQMMVFIPTNDADEKRLHQDFYKHQ